MSNVKLNSIASKLTLKIGDQLLFINNKSLIQLTLLSLINDDNYNLNTIKLNNLFNIYSNNQLSIELFCLILKNK
jgi:hypothetical protein